jgi:branched-chain amino acid transport system permease protein
MPRGWPGAALLAALVIAAPFVLYPIFVMKVLCWALFACAFDLLLGFAGLMSFGHAAYWGMGSYAGAWLARYAGVTPELAILAGGAAGAALGLVFGWLAIRRQGIYFAMITLAFAQMTYFVCVEAPFTHGEDGIQQVPRGSLLGLLPLASDMAMYWLVAAVFLGGFLLLRRCVASPYGQVLKAIRENEPRAISLGYRVERYKLLAFVLSAGLAGIAGATNALVFGIATLTDVGQGTSGDVLLMALLGGMGTLFGPAAGALLVQAMQTYLAPFGAWVTVTEGAVFVLCVLTFRRGIVGTLLPLARRAAGFYGARVAGRP